VSALELPTSRFSSLCNEASVNGATEFILALYTCKIGAPGCHAKALFQVRSRRKTKMLPQRISV
jgi:hypothetical protein